MTASLSLHLALSQKKLNLLLVLLPTQRMHDAVLRAATDTHLLLPGCLPADGSSPEAPPALPAPEEVARSMAVVKERGATMLNVEQRTAIACMLAGAGQSLPFVLFGPPGAGVSSLQAAAVVHVIYWDQKRQRGEGGLMQRD